jgi:hypothetical protein
LSEVTGTRPVIRLMDYAVNATQQLMLDNLHGL